MSQTSVFNHFVNQVIKKNPWIDTHFSTSKKREFRLNKKDGTYRQNDIEKTPANRMVNALLTLYSNSTCEFAQAKGLDVPIAWENRDRVDSSIIRRFGTQPLRNWLSQQQQRQVRAAMKMELPLSRKECAMTVMHHNSKRKMVSSLEGKGRNQMSFEILEAHCSNVLASGEERVLVNAIGLGRGGAVRLQNFNVEGTVSRTIQKGQIVQVAVTRMRPETKSVVLEVIDE